jgi:membrane-bound lytic murein transglycosylase D
MRILGLALLALTCASAAAEPAAPPTPAPPTSDDLYKLGKELFDENAPPEVKEAYAFPSKEQWDQFSVRLQHALDGNSLEDLAALEPEARDTLAAARLIPGAEDFASWLESKLDEVEAAKEAAAQARLAPAGRAPPPVPYYDLWVAREKARPVPARAASLIPVLRAAFTAEGTPPELAWLAEAESTLNPTARSPAGAQGLFQLMPATAHALGLSTFLPDDRSDPDKSAHAAARLLRSLFVKFGSWPLALAAYNAGEGRVSRLLASGGAADFRGISSALPVETRMYVPKVYALVYVRTGASLDALRPRG